LTLNRVAVTGNRADSGAGIFGFGGLLTIADSTVSDNQARGDGGGLYLYSPDITSGNTTNITNTTVSGNRAMEGFGGGIIASVDADVNVESSTIVSNTSPHPGGGIFATGFGTVNVKNMIVSDNTTRDCDLSNGTITSQGHNISSDGSCGFTQPTDQQNTDPLLGPLQDNGGPTATHTLLAGSPARDSGSSDQAEDQRGKARPQDGDGDGTATDDIGALERGTVPAPPNAAPTITPLNPDPGSEIRDRTPQIRAKVTDDETNLRAKNIKLFVDDKRKSAFSYDRSNDKLAFTIKAKLEAGRRHTVEIEATDGQLATTKSWGFKVKRTN